jgi:hypothetical protein
MGIRDIDSGSIVQTGSSALHKLAFSYDICAYAFTTREQSHCARVAKTRTAEIASNLLTRNKVEFIDLRLHFGLGPPHTGMVELLW